MVFWGGISARSKTWHKSRTGYQEQILIEQDYEGRMLMGLKNCQEMKLKINNKSSACNQRLRLSCVFVKYLWENSEICFC